MHATMLRRGGGYVSCGVTGTISGGGDLMGGAMRRDLPPKDPTQPKQAGRLALASGLGLNANSKWMPNFHMTRTINEHDFP